MPTAQTITYVFLWVLCRAELSWAEQIEKPRRAIFSLFSQFIFSSFLNSFPPFYPFIFHAFSIPFPLFSICLAATRKLKDSFWNERQLLWTTNVLINKTTRCTQRIFQFQWEVKSSACQQVIALKTRTDIYVGMCVRFHQHCGKNFPHENGFMSRRVGFFRSKNLHILYSRFLLDECVCHEIRKPRLS